MQDWFATMVASAGAPIVYAALVAAIATTLTTCAIQLTSLYQNSHVRKASRLEGDIKVMKVFGELVSEAYGYGTPLPVPASLVERLLKDIDGTNLMGDSIGPVHLLRSRIESSIVVPGVPLARQRGAAEAIVNLAIANPVLRRPALVALADVGALMKDTSPLNRLASAKRPWWWRHPNW